MEPFRAEADRARKAPSPARAPRSAEADRARGRPMVCARCRHLVTHAGERIEIDGLHEYSQINPHGFIWRFGCFASAPGCVPVGAPRTEFTWFAGCAWQIEHCARCGAHLGWLFLAPERRFHGLIVGRVVEVEENG